MKAISKEKQDNLDREFKEIESKLYSKDFSLASHKEEVRKNVFGHINKRGAYVMKKKINMKKITGMMAAALIGTTLLMQTAFAQDIVERIIKSISLGNIEVVQYEEVNIESSPVPEVLAGKLFDKAGKEVTVFTRDVIEIYTAEGEKIVHFDMNTGEIITEEEEKLYEEEHTLIVKDQTQLEQYTCFEVKLPSYLPTGYTFNRAEFYKEPNGEVKDSKYISLYFVNKETDAYIAMQQRYADEETAYSIGTDEKIEEVQLNGVKAIISGGKNIDWEANGVLYTISSRGAFDKEELIKMAKSIK